MTFQPAATRSRIEVRWDGPLESAGRLSTARDMVGRGTVRGFAMADIVLTVPALVLGLAAMLVFAPAWTRPATGPWA